MLKLILCELLKAYLTKEKKPYRNYFSEIFVVIGLLLLVVTDYIYFQNETKYIGGLLISSTILFAIALVIKVIYYYLNKNRKDNPVPSMILEVVPLIIRLLPAGVLSFIVCELIKSKLASKFKKSVKKLK